MSQESEKAYFSNGGRVVRRSAAQHQEFAEILDNISSENNESLAAAEQQRHERAAYKNYIEQEYQQARP